MQLLNNSEHKSHASLSDKGFESQNKVKPPTNMRLQTYYPDSDGDTEDNMPLSVRQEQAQANKRAQKPKTTDTANAPLADIDPRQQQKPLKPLAEPPPPKRQRTTPPISPSTEPLSSEPPIKPFLEMLSNHQPIELADVELPLPYERFFGPETFEQPSSQDPDHRGPLSNTSSSVPTTNLDAMADIVDDDAACRLANNNYNRAVKAAREGLERRASTYLGPEVAAQANALSIAFEAVCLQGLVMPEWEDKKEALCCEYVEMLKKVYGMDNLVLEPHVLNRSVLDMMDRDDVDTHTKDNIQLLRCMERRFLIWEDPIMVQQQQQQQLTPLNQWDIGLNNIWTTFKSRLGQKKYDQVNLATTDTVSCALHDTHWKKGFVYRTPVISARSVAQVVTRSSKGSRPGRLYLTDGSMMDYSINNYPKDAPGLPCAVDEGANGMMPSVVGSNRGTNLFHALKNESTGTKTFTLFAPIGGGVNLTAFHFETKKRRSYNCGTGDLIVQPLATLENTRRLMRTHAAAVGCHRRHGQLLPLECYLEQGVQLVVHVRKGPNASLCELPEQSMHAFISFRDATFDPPALKVSCNDFDLVWEVTSCYWLEKLAVVYTDSPAFSGEGLPSDLADTWVQSSYLMSHPRTISEIQSHPRPWRYETQGADLQGLPDIDEVELHWGMEVIAVRLAEKLIDILQGHITEDSLAPWAGRLPSIPQVMSALRNVSLVLHDMLRRAIAAHGITEYSFPYHSFNNFPTNTAIDTNQLPDTVVQGMKNEKDDQPQQQQQRMNPHFSPLYLEKLLQCVEHYVGNKPREQAPCWPPTDDNANPTVASKQQQQEQNSQNVYPAHCAVELVYNNTDGDAADNVVSVQCHIREESVPMEVEVPKSNNSTQPSSVETPLIQLLEATLKSLPPPSTIPNSPLSVPKEIEDLQAQSCKELSKQPLDVLRMLWLLQLELEWRAAVMEPCDLRVLMKGRNERTAVEAAWDIKCVQTADELRRVVV